MELTDIEAVDVAYIENIQRENLNAVEEARMYSTRLKMIPEFEGKMCFMKPFSSKSNFIQKLAEIYKVGAMEIYYRLTLLVLPEVIQNAVELEEIPLRIANEITRFRQITEPDLREEYMLEIFNEYLVIHSYFQINPEVKLLIVLPDNPEAQP